MTSTPNFLIYGLGRSGRGVARFLGRQGLRAEWLDANPSAADLDVVAQLGFPAGDPARMYRTVVAAPGVPIDHSDLTLLRRNGAEVIGEAELAQRFFSVPILGVTGTAGKGGTSSLSAQLLSALGVCAALGGNFDPPLLDVIEGAEVAVAELSSFQLERVQDFRPAVAVITNLGIDHLDRHGSVGAYHAAKRNITRAQTEADVLILPQGLDLPTKARVRRFDGNRLALSDGQEVLSPFELPAGHHPANAAAALLAVEAMMQGLHRVLDVASLRAALLAAEPLPGRFETVAASGDLRFVEDSIATRTLAVRSALERATSPIAWIVGGRDKGADLAPLEELAAQKVAHLVAYGEDGPKFAAHFRGCSGVPVSLIEARDGEAAMRAAVRTAAGALPGRGTVLLAPIGTSFDLFADYKARGRAFAKAARELVEGRVNA